MDLGEYKTRSISNISDELIEKFDPRAKRYFGSRSQAIKIFMECFVNNMEAAYEHKANAGQMIQHSVNDVLKTAGFRIKELPNNLKNTNALSELMELHKRLSQILGI